MNKERLKQLCDLGRRVDALECELRNMRESSTTGYSETWTMASKAAVMRSRKVIEQDLEEQLAVAKREFEEAR